MKSQKKKQAKKKAAKQPIAARELQNLAAPKPIIVGRADLARLMGVTPNDVSKFLDEGMPALSAGKKGEKSEYDAVAALQWYHNRQNREDAKERARYFKSQADKVEQEVRLRSGQLVEASAVEKGWSDLVLACRERLLSLPGSALQRGVIDDAGEDVLIELVDEALQELAR